MWVSQKVWRERDTAYIDRINGRWETYCYVDGRKVNTGVHRQERNDLIRHLRLKDYAVVDISKT